MACGENVVQLGACVLRLPRILLTSEMRPRTESSPATPPCIQPPVRSSKPSLGAFSYSRASPRQGMGLLAGSLPTACKAVEVQSPS